MALSSFDLDMIRKLVRDRAGIVLGADKSYLIESRLQPVAKAANCDSIESLCLRLRTQAHSLLHRQVVEAMTTNETLFLRDAHPFETLTKTLLPQLISKRSPNKRLTIWCAACSTGQEPYSVAMLIREQHPALLAWQLRLVATDIASEVLAKAGNAIYSQLEVSRGLPPALMNRYFTKMPSGEWKLSEDVRKMVEFRELNLLESFGAIGVADIVMMRNVLIYFDVETKRQILAKVRRVLAPDGFLFLGGAETTMGIDDHFERLSNDRGGCYRLKSVGLPSAQAPASTS